jgi:hypothetical protein
VREVKLQRFVLLAILFTRNNTEDRQHFTTTIVKRADVIEDADE